MNRFIIAIPFLIFLLAAGCCHPELQPPLEAENAVFVHLNRAPGKGILIVSDDPTEQSWYITEENRPVEAIRKVPQTSVYSVWQAEISPGDEYLAVLSVGEGHPVVDIFEVRKFIDQRDDDETIAPLLTIDPYPGTIRIEGWQGDTILIIESDVPLDLLDKGAGRVLVEEPDPETRQFFLDLSTDTVRRK